MTLMHLFSCIERETKDRQVIQLFIDYMEHRVDKTTMQKKLRSMYSRDALKDALGAYAVANNIRNDRKRTTRD